MFTKQVKYRYYADAILEETEGGGSRNRHSVWSVNTSPTNANHIASFPPDLVELCILGATKPGDFLLDPFFGCQTVGLVCRRLNRQIVGIELNPEYVDQAMEFLERQPAGRTAAAR